MKALRIIIESNSNEIKKVLKNLNAFVSQEEEIDAQNKHLHELILEGGEYQSFQGYSSFQESYVRSLRNIIQQNEHQKLLLQKNILSLRNEIYNLFMTNKKYELLLANNLGKEKESRAKKMREALDSFGANSCLWRLQNKTLTD
jgi:hypothetical protein